jgi:hypothetical protein
VAECLTVEPFVVGSHSFKFLKSKRVTIQSGSVYHILNVRKGKGKVSNPRTLPPNRFSNI